MYTYLFYFVINIAEKCILYFNLLLQPSDVIRRYR